MAWQCTQTALPAHRAVHFGGGGAWLMNSQAPRCRPRQCWVWRVCTGVIHKSIHTGCGLCGRHLGSPARSLVNSQAPRCKPHRHWLWGVSTGVFHRVIHGGCGLVRPSGRGRCCKGVGQLCGGRARRRCWRSADEFAGTALQAAPVLGLAGMHSVCPQGHPRWLWTVRAHAGALLHPLRGALMKSQAPCWSPRRHWLCAVSTGVFHRVFHGGCGLTVAAHVPNRAPEYQFTERDHRQFQRAQRRAGAAGRGRVGQQLALEVDGAPAISQVVGEQAAHPANWALCGQGAWPRPSRVFAENKEADEHREPQQSRCDHDPR